MKTSILRIVFPWTAAAKGARDGSRLAPPAMRAAPFPVGAELIRRPDEAARQPWLRGDHQLPLLVPEPGEFAPREHLLIRLAELACDRSAKQFNEARQRLESDARRHRWELERLLGAYWRVREKRKDQDWREPQRLPGAARWAFRGGLAAAEWVLTVVIFAAAGEQDTVAYAMAAGLTVVMVAGWEILGRALRLLRGSAPWWAWSFAVGGLVTTGGAAVVGLASLRNAALLVVAGSAAPLAAPTWVWAAISAFVAAVGLASAYFTHDADPEVERTTTEYAHLRRAIEKTWVRWSSDVAAFDRLRATAVGEIERAHDEATAKLLEYRRELIDALMSRDHAVPAYLVVLADPRFRSRELEAEIERPPQDLEALLAAPTLQKDSPKTEDFAPQRNGHFRWTKVVENGRRF